MASTAFGATSREDITEGPSTAAGQADMVVLNTMSALQPEGLIAYIERRTSRPNTCIEGQVVRRSPTLHRNRHEIPTCRLVETSPIVEVLPAEVQVDTNLDIVRTGTNEGLSTKCTVGLAISLVRT